MPDLEQCDQLRSKVKEAYSSVAVAPESKHPFPIGRALAEDLGYGADLLDSLPTVSVQAFAGVSNVALFAKLEPGASVLDLGCGAGMDAIIASRRVGPTGRVTGIDFSSSMLERARQAKQFEDLPQLEFRQADGERVPMGDETLDIALVNGIFNLNPGRKEIFAELARVVRRSGLVYAAELILAAPLSEQERTDESSWFS